MSLVHVLAIITTKPGQRAAVLSLFNANVPAVLAEDGCIAYEATIDSQKRRRRADSLRSRYVCCCGKVVKFGDAGRTCEVGPYGRVWGGCQSHGC